MFFLLHCIRGGEDESGGKKMECAKVACLPNVNEDEEVMEAVTANKQQVPGAKPSSAGLAV